MYLKKSQSGQIVRFFWVYLQDDHSLLILSGCSFRRILYIFLFIRIYCSDIRIIHVGNKLFRQPIYNRIALIIHVCACETHKGISSEK